MQHFTRENRRVSYSSAQNYAKSRRDYCASFCVIFLFPSFFGVGWDWVHWIHRPLTGLALVVYSTVKQTKTSDFDFRCWYYRWCRGMKKEGQPRWDMSLCSQLHNQESSDGRFPTGATRWLLINTQHRNLTKSEATTSIYVVMSDALTPVQFHDEDIRHEVNFKMDSFKLYNFPHSNALYELITCFFCTQICPVHITLTRCRLLRLCSAEW
jgi:hypothetical protein